MKLSLLTALLQTPRSNWRVTISSIARTWMRRLSGARNLFQPADPLVIAASKSVHWRITRRLRPNATTGIPDKSRHTGLGTAQPLVYEKVRCHFRATPQKWALRYAPLPLEEGLVVEFQ